jgi:hypothetical protein
VRELYRNNLVDQVNSMKRKESKEKMKQIIHHSQPIKPMIRVMKSYVELNFLFYYMIKLLIRIHNQLNTE